MFAEIPSFLSHELSWSSAASGCKRRSQAPSILAIGDTWFFYPMPGGSLIDVLRRGVIPKARAIHAIGDNGASLHELVFGTYRRDVDRALRSTCSD